MIQEIGDKVFDNQFRAGMKASAGDKVFIFEKEHSHIALGETKEGDLLIPSAEDISAGSGDMIYLFSIDDEHFYMLKENCEVQLPEGFQYKSARVLRKGNPKHLCFAAMTACHLNTWYRSSRFCGRCGAENEYGQKERMMRCPHCGNVIFPRINPAVTVALTHDDKLLVTRYSGRQQTNLYALIAGFVEIGESAEECVAREVMEEVGLKVKNIRYYGSQPWGFAGNLQIGYTAEVDGSADIVLDRNELSEAFFISRDELDEKTVRPALTQEMIEDFRTGRL